MKRWLIVGLCLCFVAVAFAHDKEAATTEEKKPKEESICPTTKISDNNKCLDCHVLIPGKPVKFGLREINPHKQYDYPNFNFRFEDGDCRVGRLLLTDINSEAVEKTLVYLNRYPECKKLIIELHNPGGSMFGMWRIVSLMDSFKARGGIIETQCQGFSASASFIVFVNGSKGHRFVAPESFHMWHEAMSLSMFDIKTASSTEEEAKLMRKFQDAAHNWLAARSKVSKEKLDQLVSKKEYWLTGTEMVEMGFADGYISNIR
jgi:ATP-dependent protease ClpP protease subunit